MNMRGRAPRWAGLTAAVTAVVLVVTGLPASASVTPSPEPPASSAPVVTPSLSPSAVVTPSPASGFVGLGGTGNEAADGSVGTTTGAVGPDGAALVMDGEVTPASDGDVSVAAQPVDAPESPDSQAAIGAFGAAEVVAPAASSDELTVVSPGSLDALVADGANHPAVAGASIVVGAAVAPLKDLVGSLYGDNAAASLSEGRPDLVAAGLPRTSLGDSVSVDVTPQLSGGAIPGAAFAAKVSLDQRFGASWVDVAFDTSGFANAYGGDFGDRLTLMVLPDCALTTPNVPGCLVGIPLQTHREADGVLRAFVPADALSVLDVQGHMSAPRLVDLGTSALTAGMSTTTGLPASVAGGRTIIAAVSGADSQAGSFKATDLAPRGTWGVTEPAGGFTYSIPITTPPVSAGAAPSVSLNYSSQATDGKTSASNSQAGVVGEGWSMPVSYIERLYKPCTDDGGTTPELCWNSPFSNAPGEAAYVMSLQGSVQELVYVGPGTDANSVTYTAVSDPTLKVTRFFGTAGRNGNGDDDFEYFKVQTNDGSVYYFGFNPSGPRGATQSVAYEPVIGNNAWEPGNGTTNHLVVNQAYRFMMDLTTDSTGNASTYFYTPATNKSLVAGVKYDYVRDLQLSRIDYGQTFDVATRTVTAPEAKVDFDLVDRCVEYGQFYDTLTADPNNTKHCDPVTATNAASYPDVPVDLICTDASCSPNATSPTYFSTVRLNQIKTSVLGDATNPWVPVETTQLITAFPTTADGSARSLWLDSVYTHGWGAVEAPDAAHIDDVNTYLTKFSGIRLNNRVDWDMTVAANEVPQRPMDRMRISNVFTDLGGRIDVTYAQAGTDPLIAATRTGSLGTQVCPQGGKKGADYAAWLAANPLTKTNSAASSQLCFAVKSGANTNLYHNYVVTKVGLHDLVGGQPTETHTYVYGGTPGYALADSVLYAVGGTGDTSTFSSYRGFQTVTSWAGSGTESTKTTNQYFRGTGGMLASLHDGSARPDNDPRLQGMLESSKTVDGSGATVSTSKPSYTVAGLFTPSWGRGGTVPVTAEHNPYVVLSESSVATSWEAGWSSTTTSTTAYNMATYQPTQSTSVVADSRTPSTPRTQCSATDYAASISPYIVVPVASRSYDGTCAEGIRTGEVRIGYDADNGNPGSTSQVLTRGLVTTERSYSTSEATGFTTAKAEYDSQGRIVKAWMPNDVAADTGPTVEWAYEKDPQQPELWMTTVTRALGGTSTSWSERGHGNTVKAHGATDTDWTHYKYDALGLMRAGWAPTQWGQASTPSLAANIPTVMYRYDIYAGGPTLRSTPAVITTAPFVGDGGTPLKSNNATDALFPASPLTGTTRRTMTFLDGFGRSIEQHGVAPDGTGGRTVTATRYNALGQVDWASAAFTAAGSMRVLSASGATMLVNPTLASLPTATDYTYDTLGRTTATTSLTLGVPLAVGGKQVKSTYAYAGPVTSVTAPDGAKTTTTTDVLGRTSSKVIGPDTAHSTDASQTTTYAYSTLTAAGKVGFQQVTVTDPEAHATVFVSNLAGQRTAMVDPNAGATAYVYDGNGQTKTVTSPAGTITMGYDVLGRMVSRTTGGSSSATWDYVAPGGTGAATDLGLLRASTSTTHTSLGDLITTTSAVYDALHRPVSSTTKLPTSPLLGDLSGTSHETKMVDATGAAGTGFDAIGQETNVTLPAMGALPAETVTTGLRKSGSAQTLTLTSAGKVTPLVTGVTFSGTGQMLSRTYGNGLTRAYGWDPATRALTGLSASFVTSESGSAQTVFVQKDSFTRDVMGRITTSTNAVPVLDGTAADGKVTAECFTYDGFNRLSGAWTVAGTGTASCGTAAPANATATGWDASTTAYAAQWSYSTGGRITSLVKGAAGAPTTSTYTYTNTAHPAAVTQVTNGTATDSFGYDGAGRMVSRTVNGVATALTWDVTSSLVESDGQGGHVVYAYDASGQRVVQARMADGNGVGTASAYVASGQVDDPNTASTSTGDTTATRYYTFAGSTVAVRTNDGKLALMLGDEQGSTNVMMPVRFQAGGSLASATLADAAAATRTSYTPYGELRGADNLATDRGWLGQVEDRVDGASGTGLTYLNARYYDPATSRFISPDPLMNPADPKTLDPYRYADNNPVVFTDATGLAACSGLSGDNERRCMDSYKKGMGYVSSTNHQGVGLKQKAPQAPAKPKPPAPQVVTITLANGGVLSFTDANIFDGTYATVGNIDSTFGGLVPQTILDSVKANPSVPRAMYLYTYLLLHIAGENAKANGSKPAMTDGYVETQMLNYLIDGRLDFMDPIYADTWGLHTERLNATAEDKFKDAGGMVREETTKVIEMFLPDPKEPIDPRATIRSSLITIVVQGAVQLYGYEFPLDEATDPLCAQQQGDASVC